MGLANWGSACDVAFVSWMWFKNYSRLVWQWVCGWDWRCVRQRVCQHRSAIEYVPALLVSGALAFSVVGAVVDRVGHPAVPLDDAFIHFQFARNLSSGGFFEYTSGRGYVAGATSLLWPVLLAPFYWVGFDELSIIWVAWFFGFLSLSGVLVEVYRLATRLTGTATAIAVASMCALFGGFAWFAASGMETMALAWVLLRTARLSSEWGEGVAENRSASVRNHLIACAIVAPLVRPEGAIASVIAAVALLLFPAREKRSARFIAVLPLVGPLVGPLLHLAMTGSVSSNTTAVKWLPSNPHISGFGDLWSQVSQNIGILFGTILDGKQWSAVFVPDGSQWIAVMGLVSIPIVGWRTRRNFRAMVVLVIALSVLVSCTYHTFLWNRLRYLWPFAPAWFVGVGCAARLVGEAFGLIKKRWALSAPVLAGVVAGVLAGNFAWTRDDLAKSATAINSQQVELGYWARNNLPADAIIGVNDTGAIAYLSHRATFDVVGLTTQGEARYWVAGAGSRFEHYEKLYASDPKLFPSHFIVYPHWMGCEPVLGKRLHEATVYDQSILGGTTMVVYETRHDLLGSGAKPIRKRIRGKMVDELNVADLESEREHRYELGAGTRDDSNNVYMGFASDISVGDSDIGLGGGNLAWDETSGAGEWADGGRFYRTIDRFDALLNPGVRTVGVARWVGSGDGVDISVESAGVELSRVWLADGASEMEFVVPAEHARERTSLVVRVVGGGTFGSLHYWFFVE